MGGKAGVAKLTGTSRRLAVAGERSLLPAVLLVLTLVVPSPLFRADHAPDWLISKQPPETTIFGISIGASIADAMRVWGLPQTALPVGEKYPEGEYSWRIECATLTLFSYSAPESGDPGAIRVYGMRVQGECTCPGVTLRGVGLGDTLDDLVKAYGARYNLEMAQDKSDGDMIVEFFFRDESTLRAGLSSEGRVVSLLLIESAE